MGEKVLRVPCPRFLRAGLFGLRLLFSFHSSGSIGAKPAVRLEENEKLFQGQSLG